MHIGKKRLANQVMMQKGSLQESKATGTEELIRLIAGWSYYSKLVLLPYHFIIL